MIRPFFKKNYLSIIFGLLLIAGLYFISLYSYVLYHSFVELFSIIIAFGVFIIAWNSKKFLDNNYLLFVGISYFFVALLDLFHTLAYRGMGIFINFEGSNLATQLWISARYLESISLLLAIFFITRKLNYKLQFTCYLIVTTLILLSILYWEIFPVSYVEGSGLTTFKITSEYIISFILAVAIFFLHLYRKEFNRTVFSLIAISLFLTIISELSFTLYIDVYGFFNQLGHFLKLLSFFLIYKAVIETGFSQPIDLLFYKLQQREKDLKKSEEKFRSLYFSMNEGACLHEMIYDESGKPVDYRILDINNSYESIFGFKRDQVIGKKASEVYRTDPVPFIRIYAQVIDSGNPAKFEAYFPPLKKYFIISVYSPFRRKFATIFSDITEQKKIEKEIKSLSRFPSENPNPVIRMDNRNLILYANDAAKNIFRQMGNEVKDKLIKRLNYSVTNHGKKGNGKIKTVECRIGQSFFEFTIVPVKEFDYINVYGRDISGIKKAERLHNRIEKEKILNKERNKMARELHDTVTQTLFSANLITETIPRLWKKDPEAVIKKLEELRQLNNYAFKEMRVLLYDLKPSALRDENFGNLMQGLVKSFKIRSKIPIKLLIDGNYKVKPGIGMGFYRIAQEALNNVIKHSHATVVNLVLKILPGKLYMDISDNGRGFDMDEITSKNLGLIIMKERAKLIRASFNIDSSPSKGTRISVIYNRKNKPKN